ncbi:MAG: hypothetical protein GY804_08685 [Alphaproteobacteria bacterium]|nr:hypothetical protein [Alphaproteobacteria bacterium]
MKETIIQQLSKRIFGEIINLHCMSSVSHDEGWINGVYRGVSNGCVVIANELKVCGENRFINTHIPIKQIQKVQSYVIPT